MDARFRCANAPPKVSFKALIYRAQTLNLITQDQARSGFTYLNRNGFTRREELDEQIEMESPNLVQKAIELLDHAAWRGILKDSGLTDALVNDRFMLKVPVAPLFLVKGLIQLVAEPQKPLNRKRRPISPCESPRIL